VRPRYRPLPRDAGSWPAVSLFWIFLWMEMVWNASDHPAALAVAILAYSALAWTGMYVFGRERWLAQCDPFARVFGGLARLSASDVRAEGRRLAEWRLRPYAMGLIAREPAHASEVALVLLMLAAVSFDGFMETPAWAWLVDTLAGTDEASTDETVRT